MRAYLIGRPPRHLIVLKKSRWHGRGRLGKIVKLHFKDTEGKNRDLNDVGEEEPLYASIRYKSKEPTAQYGALVHRTIVAMPLSPNVTEDTLRAGTVPWDMFFEPIKTWEAWQAADKEDMLLQGIEYRDGNGCFRVYREDHADPASIRVDYQPKGCNYTELQDLMPSVQKYLDKPPPGLLNEATFFVERNSRLHTDRDVLILLAAESMVEHQLPNLGWRIADVWRMDDRNLSIQARKFNLRQTSWLRERLKRRTAAANRKRKST